MRPITADTVASQIQTENLRQRLFVAEQLNDRLMRDNRCYQDELASLLKQLFGRNEDVDALIEAAERIEVEGDGYVTNEDYLRLRVALAALRRPDHEGSVKP